MRGTNKRRRSPGPMDRRGDDRRPQRGGGYPQPGYRDRRQRSISPDPRYSRRSPPPFNKRYRREDDGYDRYGGRPGPEQYDRRVAYRERYDDDPYGRPPHVRGPPSPPAVRRSPLTYKEFMFKLPDDITPEEAQKEYQRYLAEYWGSEIRAEFQAKKNEGWMRRKYDPREQLVGLSRRNAAAKEAAQGFADAMSAGQLDPKGPDFNQGQGPSAEPAVLDSADGAEEATEAEAPAAFEGPAAPDASWTAARVASDLALSKDLMLKLDAEKGIEQNALASPAKLVPAEAETAAESDGVKAAAESNETAAEPEGVKAEAEGEKMEVKETTDAAEALNGISEEAKGDSGAAPAPEEAPKTYEMQLGQLDLQLTYLWRVHGVDYYAGVENAEPELYDACAGSKRMPRCPRPEEGEQPVKEEEEQQLKTMEEQVDNIWKPRLTAADAFESSLQKERAQQLLEDWIEEQVIKIDDNKYGCKLSQKMFVGKEYVLKHVRNKHTAVMEAMQEEIYDKIYMENFETARKQEEESAREAAMREQQAAYGAMQQGGPPGLQNAGWGADPVANGWQGGWEGGAEGFEGNGHGGWNGGQGAGPPRTGSGFNGMEGMPPGAIMGGPAVGPGQMLVLAPGAGPLGPFIAVPIEEGGRPPINSPMMGRGKPGRGRGMMGRGPPRGRGFGGPGGFGAPSKSFKSYYDLDAPENQRSVLDYGDL